MESGRSVALRGGFGVVVAGLAALGGVIRVQAQTTLPQIVVSTPSPIVDPSAVTLGSGAAAPETPPGMLKVVRDAFSSVTVVSRDEIDRNQYRTLGGALLEKPGITGSTFAPGAADRPIIRGLDNNRVRIQENGIGAQDVSALGEDHGVPIDPLAADRIEVIRGPASLRWGSQAIGGVVSATNNRIPKAIPVDGFSGRITGGLSSVDDGRDGGILLDAGAGSIALHADAYGHNGDDYHIPGGRQKNSAQKSAGAAIGGSYIFDGGFVGIAYSHFGSLYHVPGGDDVEARTRINLHQNKLTSQGEWRPGFGWVEALRFWLGASKYKHNEIGLDDVGNSQVMATFRNKEQEGRLELQHMPWLTPLGPLSGALGVAFDHQLLGTAGEAGSLLAPAETGRAASYLFEELEINDTLKVQAAGRVERVSVDGRVALFPVDLLPGGTAPPESGRNRTFTPMSASLGVLKDLPAGFVTSLTAQYVQRAPAAPELFSKGSHDATGTFEIGNPNLRKESAKTVEIGLRRPTGRWRLDASAYYTRFSGFIYKRLTGARCGEDFDTCGVEDDFAQIAYDQRDAAFHGIEIATQYDLLTVAGGTLGLDGQYDFVRARFSNGDNVPRMPPHRLGGGMFWRDDNWFLRGGVLHAFSQHKTGENETDTSGYSDVHAELSYRIALAHRSFGLRELSIGVVGRNLADARMRNAVSFKKDEILLPGRDVRVFVTARF